MMTVYRHSPKKHDGICTTLGGELTLTCGCVGEWMKVVPAEPELEAATQAAHRLMKDGAPYEEQIAAAIDAAYREDISDRLPVPTDSRSAFLDALKEENDA